MENKRRTEQDAEWLCMKWPFDPSKKGTLPGGCKLEVPWLFKTMKNVGEVAYRQLETHAIRRFLLSEKASTSRNGSISGSFLFQRFLPNLPVFGHWDKRKDASGEIDSQAKRGELEERSLAKALASRKTATIIEFYSPKCNLCKSLVNIVSEVESKHQDWLNIVMVDVENKRWLPEVLQYDIKYVPCFLLLDYYGNAWAKTGVPYSRRHVLQGLSYLLESMKPIRNRVKQINNKTEARRLVAKHHIEW